MSVLGGRVGGDVGLLSEAIVDALAVETGIAVPLWAFPPQQFEEACVAGAYLVGAH